MISRIVTAKNISHWCQINDGSLETYLFTFNDDRVVPLDWHEEDDLVELQLHFDVEDMIQEMVDNRSINDEDPTKECFHIDDKPLADALIAKFQLCIDRLNRFVYRSDDEDHE